MCTDVLGDNVLAVTAISETSARHEREDAVRLARKLGAAHLQVESHEMELPEFIANPSDKCYRMQEKPVRRIGGTRPSERLPMGGRTVRMQTIIRISALATEPLVN